MPNKGEWSEPYAAIRILGDGKLYLADSFGNKCPSEWMKVIELIRHETRDRIVSYRYNENNVDIEIYVNNSPVISIPATYFLAMANQLSKEILAGSKKLFNVSNSVTDFLKCIEMNHIRSTSADKSDIFLSIEDPRSNVVREHIGFSIKSEFGENPTLFNTAKASGFIYQLSNMNTELMNTINSMYDDKYRAAVLNRCEKLLELGCNPVFVGLPIAPRAGCRAFQENLDLIDPRLVYVIERILWNRFFKHETCADLAQLIKKIVVENPCNLTRPEIKYSYMFKSFIYATYCGMTASTLWDGKSRVDGGFIKVGSNGDVVAHYALESDAFKTYLFNNCYLEFPSTDPGHGDYGRVYLENGNFYFRLNFQIRYR